MKAWIAAQPARDAVLARGRRRATPEDYGLRRGGDPGAARPLSAPDPVLEDPEETGAQSISSIGTRLGPPPPNPFASRGAPHAARHDPPRMERPARPLGPRRRSPRREAPRSDGRLRPPGALPDDARGAGRRACRARLERPRLPRVRPDALVRPQLRRPRPGLRLHLRADPRRGDLPHRRPPRHLALRRRHRLRDLLHPHRQAEARPRQLRRRRAHDRSRRPLRGPAQRGEAEGLARRLVVPRSEGDQPRRPPRDVRLGERGRPAHDDRAPRRARRAPEADAPPRSPSAWRRSPSGWSSASSTG